MSLSAGMPSKKISKSTMSMFLRTRCDKELYLSLHDKDTMAAAGLPEPVKRPGIGTLSSDGKEFEFERNEQIAKLFLGVVKYSKIQNEYQDIDLENCLLNVTATPLIVLQGKFSIKQHKTQTLQNIGLSPTDVAIIPDIADFIPDILVIRELRDGELVVCPDGSRVPIYTASNKIFAIEIFDIKHTSEANPSYRAEIAMYALMLSNWLYHHPTLKNHFYVTMNAYLWTRFKQGDSKLDQLEKVGVATVRELLNALAADSEDANLCFYLAAVRRFFEDVARVIRMGDATPGAWVNLDWHVGSTCSNCDWLGDTRHLSQAQKSIVSGSPSQYCMPAANMNGHLSLVPGITRGARKILQSHALSTTADLASAAGHPALQEHTLLKKDARYLPTRSAAILSGALSKNPSAAIASLVKSANLFVFASVNFDPSSGLLTGLAISGVATNFTVGQAPVRFQAVPYLIDQKTLKAEWVALEAFLIQIGEYIEQTEKLTADKPKGQIHFWEEREFKELCNAIGRHLPKVLALTQKRAKSLAWLFPPEELIAKPESFEASVVVTVEDIVRRLVFTPTRHVITLFDTSEHYPSGFVQSVKDPYYREYLSNGIPRERIYEIWGNTPQIKRGTKVLPRNTVITEFSNTLVKQVKALESVCERLRTDYAGQFKMKAPSLSTTIPQGANKVSFDGKLWIWWDSLEFNASQLEATMRLALDGERLEATYEAIILRNGRQVTPNRYEFDVSPGSTEAKFKEDSRLTLGKLDRPGMPLEDAIKLLTPAAPTFPGDQAVLHMPLWSAIEARLIQFDRVSAKALVEFTNDREPQFIPYLITHSSVDLLTDVFLLETKSPSTFDWSKYSSVILKKIGNPSIAVADQNAADAMGITPKLRKGGGDPVTPPARVLWAPDDLERQSVIPNAFAQAIAAYVETRDGLNQSQAEAVEHAAERALTIIWGPPGTGKTKTLAALLHGLTQDAVAKGHPLKILVTGPTYKAVEEVMHRTAKSLSQDLAASASMFMGYSRGRALGVTPNGLGSHISYTVMQIDKSDTGYLQCCTNLRSNSGVIILGCQIRQARRFPQELAGSSVHPVVHPVFDVVVIDESSQVTVSQSLSALCGLKDGSRLIVAGDHLQMPPITSIDPPSEAAYLIGSIQTYLHKRKFQFPIGRNVLERNYRSNEHVVAFARSIGYPAALHAAFPDTTLHLIKPLPSQASYPVNLPWCVNFVELLLPDHKVITLLHEDEVSSQGNHFEARVVSGIIWMLRQSVSVEMDHYGHGTVTHRAPTPDEFWSKCVGIVTPHRAQRALVIRELEQLFPGEKNLIDEAVDTVERFQGGERHTIIATFGVADTDVISGEEVFLMQLERTNVAVSRAMAKCIVIMPKSLAQYIPEDKKALDTAFALKGYLEDFCNIRIDTAFSDTVQTREGQIRIHQ